MFAIAKARTANKGLANKYENVSPVFNHTFAVVDINQVRNFTVKDLSKQYVNTEYSDKLTGQIAGLDTSTIVGSPANAKILPTHQQEVILTGTYNGNSVTVPKDYYTVTGNKISSTSGTAVLGENIIKEASNSAIKWSHLYDATTANYLRKDTTDTIKVTVYEIFSNGNTNASQPAIGTRLVENTTDAAIGVILKDSVSKVITISDAEPVVTILNAPENKYTKPTNTGLNALSILEEIEVENHGNLGHLSGIGVCTILDQYGVSMYEALKNRVTYKFSSIEEIAGYADNNFAVSGNDTPGASAIGAERGDTFVLTITVSDGKNTIAKDIKITVGADTNAKLTDGANEYVDILKKLYLEEQRKNTLK